jgi:hypothetical protein
MAQRSEKVKQDSENSNEQLGRIAAEVGYHNKMGVICWPGEQPNETFSATLLHLPLHGLLYWILLAEWGK